MEYEEAFGLQLLDGELFHFYERGDRIGYRLGSQEHDLGYSQIPHHNCCAESIFNPSQSESMVAFFAERKGTWYYVELGRFK